MIRHFDDIFDHIGHFGLFQSINFVLTGVLCMNSGYQNFIPNFIAARRDYWCKVDGPGNSSDSEQKYLAVPREKDRWSQCYRYEVDLAGWNESAWSSWNWSERAANRSVVECSSWQFDSSMFPSSVQEQYGLVCGRSWLVPLITTIYLAGHLVGAVIAGILADRFGRKPVAVGLVTFAAVSAVSAPYAPTYSLFVCIRLVTGACCMGLVQTAFVILVETTGPRWRTHVGMLYHNWFALGFAILPGVAYLIRNHVTFQIASSSLPFLCVSYIFILWESPRWLMSQGRYEEAYAVLEKMAARNKGRLPASLDLQHIHKRSLEEASRQTKGTLVDLFRTPRLRRRTLIMCLNWFATSLGYYGVSYSAGIMPGGVFLNSFLAAMVQLPANTLAVWFVLRRGRRHIQIWSLLLAGVFCIVAIPFVLIPSLPRWAITAMAMVGKLFITTSFAMVYLYAGELYPTVVRTNGVGICSMCARVGSMMSPQVKHLGEVWSALPYLLFGAGPLLAGMLSFFLPETKDCKLPETLEEGEQFPEGFKRLAFEQVVLAQGEEAALKMNGLEHKDCSI